MYNYLFTQYYAFTLDSEYGKEWFKKYSIVFTMFELNIRTVIDHAQYYSAFSGP